MNNFRKILFPVEFSKRDETAVPFVLSMAQRDKAQLVVLHVLQPPVPVYLGMDDAYPEAFDSSESLKRLHIRLREFAGEQLPKTEPECVVEIGEPAAAIGHYADNNEIDLIAMPTHGYGLFRRTPMGSVTAKVLHDSKLPVWTSAHAPEPSHRAHPQPRRILCALDMKPESGQTLEMALRTAKDAGASIELVHVPAETVSPQAAEQHLQDLLAQAGGTGLVNVQQMPWLSIEPQGRGGGIAAGIRNLALRLRAELIVIGHGSIQTMFGRLNSHSYDIIREAPCPVLSV